MRPVVRTNRLRLKHLNRAGFWPSGNARWYYRPKGCKAVPLPDKPHDNPAFLAAYATAAGLSSPIAPAHGEGSIGEGVTLFLASTAYAGKSEGTRAVWRRGLDDIRKRYGAAQRKDLRAKHILADLGNRPVHPYNQRLKVWRALCGWWKTKAMIQDNPAKDVSREKPPESDGHIPWTAADLAVFRAYWPVGTPQRLAFEVLQWTGARMSDAVRMRDDMLDGGWMKYTQAKTRGGVEIPISAAAPDFADATGQVRLGEVLAAKDGPLWMPTAFGRQRSSKAASAWFAEAAREAGLVERSAHGLRKTRLITLAERGATTHHLAAWCGQSSLTEIERYTKAADRKRLLTRVENPTQVPEVPTMPEFVNVISALK